MSQLKDIKERIDSIKKTRKMTQAMKMVAAAKFKRLSNRALSSREMIRSVDGVLNLVTGQANGLVDEPLMKNVESKRELLVLITGDRGLCGGFNANIIKLITTYANESSNDVDLFIFGKKGAQHFKRRDFNVIKSIENFQDKLDLPKVKSIGLDLMELYESNTYCKISLFYNEFKTAISSNLINKQLFPVVSKDTLEESNEEVSVIIQPSSTTVLHALCRQFVVFSLYSAFLESSAAEQGSRMAAMDAATDNAGEMIGDLTLIYNRQRQAQITTELTEIVAGAEALVM